MVHGAGNVAGNRIDGFDGAGVALGSARGFLAGGAGSGWRPPSGPRIDQGLKRHESELSAMN